MKKDYLKSIIGLLLFGSNGIVASHIALTSYEIVFLRSILGAVLLIILYLASGHKFTAFSHKRDLMFLIASGLAMAVNWLFLFEAFQQMGVSLSIIINYCGPAIAVAASVILLKDTMTVRKAVALGVALLGAILVNSFSTSGQVNTIGLICAVLSAFSYAALVILNKCSKQIVGAENAVIQLSVTAVTVAVYMGLRYGLQMNIPTDNWPWILWLSLINTGLGCYFYFSSISHLPVQTVAVCSYIEPLSAVIFSLVFLHETIAPLQWLGGLLIIAGALFSELKRPQGITENKH